jgi:hypothetical protein
MSHISKCSGLLKLYTFVVLWILLYWCLLLGFSGTEGNAVNIDPFNKMILEVPFFEKCCSMWPLSHFIFFLIIGFLFPSCDVPAILGGIGWELAEVGVYYTLGHQRQGTRKNGKIQYSQNWWAGSWQDIAMNIGGFYVGKFLSFSWKKFTGKRICFSSLDNCPEKNDVQEQKIL